MARLAPRVSGHGCPALDETFPRCQIRHVFVSCRHEDDGADSTLPDGYAVRRALRHPATLAIGLCAIAAAYIAISLATVAIPPPTEQTFERAAGVPGGMLQVYLEILSFDPVRDALEARLDFATSSSPLGSRFAGVAGRDTAVEIADGESDREILLRHGEPMASVSATINIGRGSIDAYPFDHYTTRFSIAGYADPDGAEPVPLRVVVWDRLANWGIEMVQQEKPLMPAGIDLKIDVRRPDQIRFFAVTLYFAMGLMGCMGISIGVLLSLGVRRMDTTLAAVLSSMVFALPAMRNILPGAPPLGVRADSIVFLWAEVAVVIGLVLVVSAWARGDRT
jgi:hypothetical protein